MSGIEPKRCIIYQRPGLPEVATMTPGRDVSWEEAMDGDRTHDCVPVEANQAMYILYTSGTTGKEAAFNHRRKRFFLSYLYVPSPNWNTRPPLFLGNSILVDCLHVP